MAVDHYGSEGWGFESLRARPGQRPLPIMEGALLLTQCSSSAATALMSARPLATVRAS